MLIKVGHSYSSESYIWGCDFGNMEGGFTNFLNGWTSLAHLMDSGLTSMAHWLDHVLVDVFENVQVLEVDTSQTKVLQLLLLIKVSHSGSESCIRGSNLCNMERGFTNFLDGWTSLAHLMDSSITSMAHWLDHVLVDVFENVQVLEVIQVLKPPAFITIDHLLMWLGNLVK